MDQELSHPSLNAFDLANSNVRQSKAALYHIIARIADFGCGVCNWLDTHSLQGARLHNLGKSLCLQFSWGRGQKGFDVSDMSILI